MGADEEGTLERLKALRQELLDPKIAEHHGRILKTTGDGLLVEFASVVDAVRCAVAVQQAMPERDTGASPHNRNELRRRSHREVGADAEYPIHPVARDRLSEDPGFVSDRGPRAGPEIRRNPMVAVISKRQLPISQGQGFSQCVHRTRQ
jgi:hypothetical protein